MTEGCALLYNAALLALDGYHFVNDLILLYVVQQYTKVHTSPFRHFFNSIRFAYSTQTSTVCSNQSPFAPAEAAPRRKHLVRS